jgi:hypothetical protein
MCCGEVITVLYSGYVSVAFVIQHAKCIHCSILSTVACPFLPYFSTFCHKGTIFGKSYWKKFWFFLQLLSETFLITGRISLDIIINVHRSSCKVPVISVRFWLNLDFLVRFSKNTQISHLMKIQWEASCSMLTDRRDEANSSFSQFCENR